MPEENRLAILPDAQFELEAIALTHMELVGPSSARKITDCIYTALERLCVHPRMGRRLEMSQLDSLGYRKLICGNYLCFYSQMETTTYVYHIVDGRTDYPRLFSHLPRTVREEAERRLMDELFRGERSAAEHGWLSDEEIAQKLDADEN